MVHRKGFTLIELMIVMIIVAILAAAAVPLYTSIVSRAYESEIVSALGTIRSAARAYKAENGVYPTQMADLTGGESPLLSSDDFADLKYVAFAEFSVNASENFQWDGAISGYNYVQVIMTKSGSISRS